MSTMDELLQRMKEDATLFVSLPSNVDALIAGIRAEREKGKPSKVTESSPIGLEELKARLFGSLPTVEKPEPPKTPGLRRRV
jgi:hypothetical protein